MFRKKFWKSDIRISTGIALADTSFSYQIFWKSTSERERERKGFQRTEKQISANWQIWKNIFPEANLEYIIYRT